MIKVEASYPIVYMDGHYEHVTRRYYVDASAITIQDSNVKIRLDTVTASYPLTPDIQISFEEISDE